MKKRYNSEQISEILQEKELGTSIQDICQKYEISQNTFYRWRAKYGRVQTNPNEKKELAQELYTDIEKKTAQKPQKVAASAEGIIYRHTIYSMLIGTIPVPFLDIASVTANQIEMIRQLAGKYSVDFNREIGKSIASSLTGATLARTGASVIKTIPGVGTWIGMTTQALLAGSSTYALGQLFENHFKENKGLLNLDIEQMKSKYNQYLKKGMQVSQNIKKKFKKKEHPQNLEKLEELKRLGAISEKEYTSTKKGILDTFSEQQS
ncbi:MAG: DUF697 domain-containing protein [Spirochaetota bacterium]